MILDCASDHHDLLSQRCGELIQFASKGLRHFGKSQALAEEVRAYLEKAYCGPMSVETGQLSSLEEKEWFSDRFEELKSMTFSPEERRQLAKIMLESQVPNYSFEEPKKKKKNRRKHQF